ncbi:MAG: DUF4435 domain-containing protein [Caldilineales bacterium]|nr:DUF4435 domain-containing protein [Caldilineales bacterium]MCW5858399.1 DUF4435 domain-containing protein [Caldilineales bacterium]
MNGYLAIDELEVTVRAGRGVAIIVEGQNAEEDPWFYNQWFGDRASQVTFFPQNGWPRVIDAVAELRRRCPDIPIYGIIDRDFAEDEELDSDFITLGIIRTPAYTLENYLLDPACWAAVFRFIFRRQNVAPDGWDQPEQARNHIEAAFRACLDLTAYNQVVKRCAEHYPESADVSSVRGYHHHPDAFKGEDPARSLSQWGQEIGCSEDLGRLFAEKRAGLDSLGLAGWQQLVSGKHVLGLLHNRFPRLRKAGRFGLSHYLNLYLRECPDAPADLAQIIGRIIADVDASSDG